MGIARKGGKEEKLEKRRTSRERKGISRQRKRKRGKEREEGD